MRDIIQKTHRSMKMKKIVLGFGISALLVSLAFGASLKSQFGQSGDIVVKTSQKKCPSKKFGGCRIMGAIMNLDLTPAQRAQIRTIMTTQKSGLNPTDAFSENSFDKEKFIQIVQSKKANKIKNKAQMISDVYTTLNDMQKKNLKKMLNKINFDCSSCKKCKKK